MLAVILILKSGGWKEFFYTTMKNLLWKNVFFLHYCKKGSFVLITLPSIEKQIQSEKLIRRAKTANEQLVNNKILLNKKIFNKIRKLKDILSSFETETIHNSRRLNIYESLKR